MEDTKYSFTPNGGILTGEIILDYTRLETKLYNRYDKYSVAFTAEDLNSDEYPELLFWDGRQTVSNLTVTSTPV